MSLGILYFDDNDDGLLILTAKFKNLTENRALESLEK